MYDLSHITKEIRWYGRHSSS